MTKLISSAGKVTAIRDFTFRINTTIVLQQRKKSIILKANTKRLEGTINSLIIYGVQTSIEARVFFNTAHNVPIKLANNNIGK